MNASVPSQESDLERIARRRAGAKLGWYIHAAIYIAVNTVLAALSALGERHWAVFPALGWGLGLAAHALLVFLRTGGLHERMVQAELRRLELQRDPW
jgi:hypothetical protein